MPKKCTIQLSFAPGFATADVPMSEKEMQRLFSETLSALSKEARYKNAQKKLKSALQRLGLYLCGDKEMRQFQKSFRKLDRSTDVLSFPTLELGAHELASLPVSELSLGDLAISLPAITRGAKRGRRTERLEFVEVFIHGILHLLGFDHITENAGVTRTEALKMIKIQKELFLKLKAPIKS